MKTLVAIAQMTSGDNRVENLRNAEKLIYEAHERKARFLCLPENFAYLGNGAIHEAEPLDGATITFFKTLAKKLNIWLSLGGFLEKIDGQKKAFNSHLIIDAQGEINARYRKIHCFSAQLPDDTAYDEAKTVEAGDEAITFMSPFFVGGLSICYDLRFASLYSALRALSAQVLFIPAAFTKLTGEAHWEVLLRARAIENQSYVVAAAQYGQHNQKRATYGRGMIVDPWGRVIAQCDETSEVACAEIDLAYLEKVRLGMPVFEHRRHFNHVGIKR